MKKLSLHQWVALVVALVIVAWFFAWDKVAMSLFDRGSDTAMMQNTNMQNETQAPLNVPGLTIQEVLVGTGAEAATGKTVTVNYTGKFQDGRVFDTSIGREPFTFPLGQGFVIAGWEKGVPGMKEGGKRRLVIAPELGYGFVDMKDAAGNVVIPANSVLIFEVELLEVK